MRAENREMVNCPSCSATLVAGLRFCRMCGYRLGEGVEEYVPTQRFDAASMPTAAAPPPATDPFQARQTWGNAPMQPVRPFGATNALGQAPTVGSTSKLAKMCRPRGAWLWVTIIILVLVVGDMVPLLNGRNNSRDRDRPPATSVIKEADDFVTADGGGAMITGLAGPGSSLEAAGLVGGDVITSLGGRPVHNASEFEKFIAELMPGQETPFTFIHDNEVRQGTLRPMPPGSFRGMDPIRERPSGRAVLNINFGDDDRVRLPDSNIFGVKLDSVERNGPAYIAGLQKGDIVIEFDGKSIRTAGDLRYRIGAAIPLSVVNIVVVRAGQTLTIPVKLGSQR